jgi:carboxylesterase type B
MILDRSHVVLHHSSLNTTFHGIEHTVSSPASPIHQFRGIGYAIVPARFRQSVLCTSYPPMVDATKFGYASLFHYAIYFRSASPLSPICPQPNQRSLEEELIGLPYTDIPRQVLVQDEFDCLNLNITAPAHRSSLSRLPVMIWVHGLVLPFPRVSSNSFRQGWQPRVWLQLGL